MMQMWFVFWVAQRLVQGDLVEMCEGDTQGMLQLVTSGTSTSFGPPAPESTHGPKTSQAASQPSSSPKPSTSDTSTKSTKSTTSTTSTTIQPPAAAITTFQWEPHWQCAEADASCTRAAQAKFQQLVEESGAQIAAALELQGAAVPNWISSKEYEDAVSIMVAPGWQVLKEGGGNICCGGQRGLAVMLVKPPWPVSNCEELCVMAVHPGHSPIQSGKSIVQSICGSATDSCAIALGDWNVDAAGVSGGSFDSWQRLVGGNPPVFVVPNSETCCHPSTCCRFDHLATNIPGAKPVHVHVWDYQLTDRSRMDEEHMPVAVHFTVPMNVSMNVSLIS